MDDNQKKSPTRQDYERLGRALTTVFARDYLQIAHHWKRFILLSFVRGLFIGFGSVIGATILIGLSLWVLNLFDPIPLVGDLVQSIQESIRQSPAAP